MECPIFFETAIASFRFYFNVTENVKNKQEKKQEQHEDEIDRNHHAIMGYDQYTSVWQPWRVIAVRLVMIRGYERVHRVSIHGRR